MGTKTFNLNKNTNDPLASPLGGHQVPPQAQQLNMNVKLPDLPTFECPKCKHKLFEPLFAVKKLSAIQSSDGKEQLINVRVMSCANCSHVPKEFGGGLIND